MMNNKIWNINLYYCKNLSFAYCKIYYNADYFFQ